MLSRWRRLKAQLDVPDDFEYSASTHHKHEHGHEHKHGHEHAHEHKHVDKKTEGTEKPKTAAASKPAGSRDSNLTKTPIDPNHLAASGINWPSNFQTKTPACVNYTAPPPTNGTTGNVTAQCWDQEIWKCPNVTFSPECR